MSLQDLRREYSRARLDESSVDADPFEQFRQWFQEANRAGLIEPNAMTLATASASSVPSARVVLLKDYDGAGFAFYTDTRSRKGLDLAENPVACLAFYWAELERQVRITGAVERVDDHTAAGYFETRPLGSQLGAWASHQSTVLDDGREQLEERLREATGRYAGGPVPKPPYWGGYRVVPREFEFWQGRESRLHDRIRYRKTPDGWVIQRLSP